MVSIPGLINALLFCTKPFILPLPHFYLVLDWRPVPERFLAREFQRPVMNHLYTPNQISNVKLI